MHSDHSLDIKGTKINSKLKEFFHHQKNILHCKIFFISFQFYSFHCDLCDLNVGDTYTKVPGDEMAS